MESRSRWLWPSFRFSPILRLCIVAGVFALCLIFYLQFFISFHNGSLLVIPTLLAAWFFRMRGMLLCVAATTTVLLIARLLGVHTIEPTLQSILVFLFGLVLLLAQGIIVVTFRFYLEKSYKHFKKPVHAAHNALVVNVEPDLEVVKAENDQLFAHLNHEIRTPLTVVYGYLQILHLQQEQLNHEKRAAILQTALQSCEELQDTVGKILKTLAITQEQQRVSCEAVWLLPLVLEVLRKQPGKDYPTTLRIADDILVLADRTALLDILFQLLKNVSMYTPPGTQVCLQAVYAYAGEGDPRGRQIVLSVSDTGPGIPPEEMSRLFKRFTRLTRDSTGSIRGAGVGLYRSQHLAQAMGGRIWAESSGIAGEGSRFCIMLPCPVPAHPV